jgi:Calcineurin-like phosphoesterase
VGDATERGLPAEDKEALGFLGRLPGDWVTALGNHDVLGNKRTVAAWARAYGQESQNLCVDLGFVRLIVVGPNRTEPGKRAGRLSLDTLAFLDERLEEAEDTDCWIVCHWPLFKTVMGDPRKHFTSAMSAFYAKPPARIRELLLRHPHARAWISGHTHSPLSVPGLIKRKPLGPERSIAAINASALVGVGKTRDPADPLCSLYLTHRPDRIEVRCRDHRAGEWRNIKGRRVAEVRSGG